MKNPDEVLNDDRDDQPCKCICEFIGMMNITDPCGVCPEKIIGGCDCEGYPEGCPLANK